MASLRNPFGEISFEEEIQLLGGSYSSYYFDHVPFNEQALAKETYLIIGRRGAGKSSLAYHFTFQEIIKNSSCIDVDEPEVFHDVLERVNKLGQPPGPILCEKIARIWEVVIWELAFNQFQEVHESIKKACLLGHKPKSNLAKFIRELITTLLVKFGGERAENLATAASDWLDSDLIKDAREACLTHCRRHPLIVAFDTLEHYDVHDHRMMTLFASLIQAGAKFSSAYADRGLHVKIFVMAELFPHLKTTFISNTLKYVKNSVFMHWRPKDLLRLICWRFHQYLEEHQQLLPYKDPVAWTDYGSVLKSMWIPYFGEFLTNGAGVSEPTFTYILRHTQNRPRQLILICNQLAQAAMREGTFPKITNSQLVRIVRAVETELAIEVLNSYSQIHSSVEEITNALQGIDFLFNGNILDKIASRTASQWKDDTYSPYLFRKLVAELGIIGRVRHKDESSGVIAADFEYFMQHDLPITVADECVVHPMFYEKFNVKRPQKPWRVYPFPAHPEYAETFENPYS